jgi:hypothetical protein
MEIVVGVVLAIGVGIFLSISKMDRDRSVYPVIMIVIAMLYVLFAVMGGSTRALGFEIVAALLFIAAAVVGYRSALWIVAVALAAHGVFDLVHPRLIDNPGVPTFWPMFCSAYDITAAIYLGWIISRDRIQSERS